MLDNIPCSRPWNSRGEGRSAVRCCGLFSCLQLVPPAWGPAGKRRGPPSVGMPLLADAPTRLKKVCAPALPLRGCGFIRTSPLRRLRRGAPAPPGARLPRRVARRSGLLAAPTSRLLRFAPAAVAAPLRGSAPPLLPGGSVGRGSALALVGRRCRCRPSRGPPLRPRCARSPVSPPPARPGSPPRLAPGSAPAGGLRGRLAGRCAPARRPLGGRPAPPRFGALRRGGCRCGGKRESRPCGRLSGKAEN